MYNPDGTLQAEYMNELDIELLKKRVKRVLGVEWVDNELDQNIVRFRNSDGWVSSNMSRISACAWIEGFVAGCAHQCRTFATTDPVLRDLLK